MGLNKVPPELIVTIAQALDPFSSLEFALTCKTHWKLCESLIAKHKHLFAKNHTVDATDNVYPYENHILWEKLREILENQSIGEYVREINLPSSRATYLQGNAAHEFQLTKPYVQPPQEDLDRYAVVTRELEKLYRDDWTEHWNEWILKGSSEPIIVMLVHYMPYLRTFRFTDLELSGVFRSHLSFIVLAYRDPTLAPKLPFQHLTTVAVAHWDTEGSCNVDWCILFCAIPSVRNFVAEAMGGSTCDVESLMPVSNVKEIVLHNSRLDTECITRVVRNASELEKFSYEIGGTIVAEDVTPDPKENIMALVEHVGHSLQHLIFEYPDIDEDEYLVEDVEMTGISLRDFKQLKTLRIDWHLLQPDAEFPLDSEEELEEGFHDDETSDVERNGDFDVRSLLPESLEKLYIVSDSWKEETADKISKLQESNSEYTPLLKNIYYRARSERWENPHWEALQDNRDVPGLHENPLLRHLQGHGCS